MGADSPGTVEPVGVQATSEARAGLSCSLRQRDSRGNGRKKLRIAPISQARELRAS